MIYLDKELVYPSNTVIDDAACRAVANTDSYSPINGEIYDIVEEYRIKRAEAYGYISNPKRIMESMTFKDFDYEKAKKVTLEVEDDGSFMTGDEIKRFEGKTIDMIVKYFKEAWDNWQFKQDMNREQSNVNTYKSLQFRDNAGDDLYTFPDELEVDTDYLDEYSEEEIISDVQQLVYYLRLLQEMSSIKGYSAIQTLILIAKYNGNRSSIAAEGLYKVNTNGEIVDRYAATANTSRDFINWIDLCEGSANTPEAERWVNIINKFKEICERLHINLANEDYTIYTPDYVNNQISLYLASNEEYVDTIGKIDKNVLALLSPDKIFAQRNALVRYDESFANTTGIDKVIIAYQAVFDELEAMSNWVDDILTKRTQQLQRRISDLYDPKEEFVESVMLYLIEKVFGITGNKAVEFYRRKYYFNSDNLLWFEEDTASNHIFSIKSETIRRVFGSWPVVDAKCYFTMSGAFIFLDSTRDLPSYIMAKDLIENGVKATVKNL